MNDQPPAYAQKGQYPPPDQYPPPGQYPPVGQQYPPPGGQYQYQQPQGAQYAAGQPGVVVVQQPAMQSTMHIDDHLVFAIIVTLFCCWPIGIFAIIQSCATKDAKQRGDAAEATRLSAKTKKFCFITLGVGVCFTVCWIIFVIIYYVVIVGAVLSQASNNNYNSNNWD